MHPNNYQVPAWTGHAGGAHVLTGLTVGNVTHPSLLWIALRSGLRMWSQPAEFSLKGTKLQMKLMSQDSTADPLCLLVQTPRADEPWASRLIAECTCWACSVLYLWATHRPWALEFPQKPPWESGTNVQVLLPAASPLASEEYKQPPVSSKPRDSKMSCVGAGFIPEVCSSHHGYHPLHLFQSDWRQ